jgi:hypothetical protein
MNGVEAKITSGIASQSGHWYATNGNAAYEIEKKDGGMRPVNLRDARKHNLVPSVTTVMQVMAKPGLEVWKQKQVLLAALTLPMQDGESLDDYASRIVADSKQQAIEAAQRGTNIHAAIEAHIKLYSVCDCGGRGHLCHRWRVGTRKKLRPQFWVRRQS